MNRDQFVLLPIPELLLLDRRRERSPPEQQARADVTSVKGW